MLFNSWIFPPFLALVLLLYHLSGHKVQNRLLLIASYVFYGYWDWRFLSLIFASTLSDYLIGRRLSVTESTRARKLLVGLSCTLNLGLLAVFKYLGFFVASFSDMVTGFGIHWDVSVLHIVLPVGISFYTFQTMSYTIDLYRGKLQAERNFLDFALFVSFFPQLVAGPIERAANLLPQVKNKRIITRDHCIEGGWLILKGFFLKMVIADNLAIIVNEIFAGPSPSSGLVALIGIYAFAFQIYGDFAGYSKIARGVSLLFGIRLMRNFNLPYLSQSPSEFWTRWHISLSSWLRDYLYIPLGGNRGKVSETYRNLLLTMILGGIWHGAGWTFIAWGVYQGGILVIYRLIPTGSTSSNQNFIIVWAKRLFFFQLTCLGWLLFRAESFPQVINFLQAILFAFTPTTDQIARFLPEFVLFTGMVIGLGLLSKDRDDPRSIPGWKFGIGPALCSLMVLGIIVLTPLVQQTFVYFQF